MPNQKSKSEWISVKILKDQYEKLAQLAETKEARAMGINSNATALKVAIADLCEKIEEEIKYPWSPPYDPAPIKDIPRQE